MTMIRTARLTVRRFRDGDADAMMDVLGDPEVMRFSDLGALTRAQVREWTAQHVADYEAAADSGRWAVVEHESNAVIGYAGLTREPERCAPGEAELGFRLARGHWGRGYGTEVATAVVGYGFTVLYLQRIIAIVDPANAASVRVIEKLGMGFDGLVSFPGYDHPDRKYVLSRSA